MGYGQSMISQIEAGTKHPRIEQVPMLAEAVGVPVEYVFGLTGDLDFTPWDAVLVPIETEAAMATFDAESTVLPAEGPYPFRGHRLIYDEGIDPKQDRVFNVKGNSMYPVIPDGSTILVDCQKIALTEHCVYVYRSTGALLVKRAKQCPAEHDWWWFSDNPMGEKTRLQGDRRGLGRGPPGGPRPQQRRQLRTVSTGGAPDSYIIGP